VIKFEDSICWNGVTLHLPIIEQLPDRYDNKGGDFRTNLLGLMLMEEFLMLSVQLLPKIIKKL